MTETDVIHFAVARLAREELPGYAPDEGPLTDTQLRAILKLAPQGRMLVEESLF
jgi:hypothetical protein